MKSQSRQLNAKDYIADLAARGRYHFSSTDARKALGGSPDSVKLALNRLSKQKLIVSPIRGFYTIIPPEYRSLGSLPAEQFVPALMERLGLSYYAGLLSAAQFHGAAHHRPQQFQVMVEDPRRPIICGAVRVAFIVRRRLKEVPTQNFNTPRGQVRVSTPEATAVDIVGYYKNVGGLDQAATILLELAEKLDPEKLALAAATAPVTWAQRLGYLLERVEASDRAEALQAYVAEHAKRMTRLETARARSAAGKNERWRILVNAEVEAEL